MEPTSLGLTSTDISMLQFLATVVGGAFALYLLMRANKEKRQFTILNIFDKVYGDTDMVAVLYAADKNQGLKKLGEKLDLKNPETVRLEKETDKILRYFDFIGALLKSGQLKEKDLAPFAYELDVVLFHPTINRYIEHLRTTGVNLANLAYLIKYLCKIYPHRTAARISVG